MSWYYLITKAIFLNSKVKNTKKHNKRYRKINTINRKTRQSNEMDNLKQMYIKSHFQSQ